MEFARKVARQKMLSWQWKGKPILNLRFVICNLRFKNT
jgi:hypothetical protein